MRLRHLTILAAAVLPFTLPALAQDFVRPGGYDGAGYRTGGVSPYAPPRGFAEPFIQGDYIGEPFTSVPRATHLVPTPWSYGTYGVPTVSGIPAAPTGAPTLTVIHAPSRVKASRQAVFARGDDPADVRVVNVNVPRR